MSCRQSRLSELEWPLQGAVCQASLRKMACFWLRSGPDHTALGRCRGGWLQTGAGVSQPSIKACAKALEILLPYSSHRETGACAVELCA